MKLGVIIGRFQAQYLHPGHLHIIATALRECDEVVIFLGTQEHVDERNLYTVKERTEMINRIFPQVDVVVLWDCRSDQEWSDNVDIIIGNIGGEATLYHSRNSFKDHYRGEFPLKEVPEIEDYSATKIRENEQN